MTARPFLELQAAHRELERIFEEHQVALVERDLPAARRHLERFARELAAHMRVEDELLFPAYVELAPPVPGGGFELLDAEHRKLESLLGQLFERLAELERRPAIAARDVIEVLDRELTFKHLLQHHDQRECNIVYPALDEATPPARRAELWARIAALGEG